MIYSLWSFYLINYKEVSLMWIFTKSFDNRELEILLLNSISGKIGKKSWRDEYKIIGNRYKKVSFYVDSA